MFVTSYVYQSKKKKPFFQNVVREEGISGTAN